MAPWLGEDRNFDLIEVRQRHAETPRAGEIHASVELARERSTCKWRSVALKTLGVQRSASATDNLLPDQARLLTRDMGESSQSRTHSGRRQGHYSCLMYWSDSTKTLTGPV